MVLLNSENLDGPKHSFPKYHRHFHMFLKKNCTKNLQKLWKYSSNFFLQKIV